MFWVLLTIIALQLLLFACVLDLRKKQTVETSKTRGDIHELSEMLKGHFGILWNMEDLKNWLENHEQEKPTNIPTTDGEWRHLGTMLKPIIGAYNDIGDKKLGTITYRGVNVEPSKNYFK